jgi:glyoxylase-like metal-dependent hydrolase (beta-lactamase superfamily II)
MHTRITRDAATPHVSDSGSRYSAQREIEKPGHAPGHLSFWGGEDRALILGDVLFHRNPLTFRKRLSEPFRLANFDRRSNLTSARRLAALEARVVCFGHGAPLTDGKEFCRFFDGLPDV